ncbi:MAG: hypothetical protein PWQ28_231 [Candidatus Woesearchaeota archaeon]|nr:hypothetical protein [Candidatus Woesearchaeota archaeon]
MKLLIVSDSFLPRWDGVARFLYELIPRINDSFDITVVAPMFMGKGIAFKNVEVLRVPLTRLKAGDYQIPKASLGLISKAISQSDIVWTNTLGPLCMNACLSAKIQNKPIIAYVHSIEWELFHLSIKKSKTVRRFVYSLTKMVARIHYNLIDLLIVPTEEVAEKLTFSGIKTNKTVVRLGVDTKRFRPTEDKKKAKEAIGINPDSFVVGYCGRLAREKDLATLRRAFNRFKIKYKDAKLLIVGDGVKEIKESFMNIKEVVVVGSTNEVEKYYRAMDVFVLPSLTETTALTVLEAMASGVVVVSTPVGISPMIIKNGETGFLFEMKNEYQLYKILDKIASNRALIKKISENGRSIIEKNFSWDKTAEGIKEILLTFSY